MALDCCTVCLLPTFIEPDRFLELQSSIPTLTHDITEADVVVANLSHPGRARFELRRLGLATDPVLLDITSTGLDSLNLEAAQILPSRASPGRSGSGTASPHSVIDLADERRATRTHVGKRPTASAKPVVQVVKLSWLSDSLGVGRVLPLDDYLIYQGRIKNVDGKAQRQASEQTRPPKPDDILSRAQLDAPRPAPSQSAALMHDSSYKRHHERSSITTNTSSSHSKRPRLLQETTSEHDIVARLPPVPAYLHTTYSCERPSPADPPNDAFIDELKTIRTHRTLNNDKIGVRAYSTAIATLCAYPYSISTAAGTYNSRCVKKLPNSCNLCMC